MDTIVLVYLSSGLFLGWALGANDAANVFGTAVGARMIRFSTAAVIASLFIILGAVLSGAGAAHGLGKLGAINALPGAFMTALAAAITVYGMTKLSLPVSTTQAIVGAIVGWNLYSGSITDMTALGKIIGTWIAAPILGAIFSVLIYKSMIVVIRVTRIHLIDLDTRTRIGLVLAGAFGAYSLGANNIGNVMGVFVSSSPFSEFEVAGLFTLTSVQQLFLVGAIAIAVGVFTYSKRVMMTVGDSLMPLTPIAAWVVVIAQSVVLFLFASTSLEHALLSVGLPAIPLIPVSSSQAVVGAVIGISMVHGIGGARLIRWRVLANIAFGWISTPVAAAVICFISLFFLQNVFNQQVYQETRYSLTTAVLDHLQKSGIDIGPLHELRDQEIVGAVEFRDQVRARLPLTGSQEKALIASAEIFPTRITAEKIGLMDAHYLSTQQIEAFKALVGREYRFRWQLEEALSGTSPVWKKREAVRINKVYNKVLNEKLRYVEGIFHIPERTAER